MIEVLNATLKSYSPTIMLPECAEVIDASVIAIYQEQPQRVSVVRMLELAALLEDASLPEMSLAALGVADIVFCGE